MKSSSFYQLLFAIFAPLCGQLSEAVEKPHIILVMADDMGWGQTGYRNHSLLKTPHLDEMAANGLRFERFYAGGPVCSPTRASVLTGRSHDRTGVLSHGYALRLQEKTLPQALRDAGYVTGHFGKWHLNGLRGPGVPILADDARGPGGFGFDEWVSVTNFYDMNPLMSRQGEIEEFLGDSSEIAVDEAVKFLGKHREGGKPMFAVVWYGTPHSPFKASDADKAPFAHLDEESADHYGELVAMDRSIGKLRSKLREFDLAENTMLVFCSDNGGLPKITPETVGGLNGFKGSVYEGGLRVPGIIEWPRAITPRVTSHPACVMDLFPTIADVIGLPEGVMTKPVDGVSLRPLFAGGKEERGAPIGFRYQKQRAIIDDRYKLLTKDFREGTFELYDLLEDPNETSDLAVTEPGILTHMKEQLLAWDASMEESFAGKDYPEGRVSPADPEPVSWYETPQYSPLLEKWRDRGEFQRYLKPGGKGNQGGKKKPRSNTI